MDIEKIIRYNFLAQNLNALGQAQRGVIQHPKDTTNVLKMAEVERIKNDTNILAKELESMHREIFEDLEDELGCSFKYLLKKPINGMKKV